jgi:hypothetical protein
VGDGLKATFQRAVRRALGLEDDPGKPPRIDRLAPYRAEVQAAATDGSTVDVQPASSRVDGHKGVRQLVGIPGAVVVVEKGAVVHLLWEGGDPSQPRAVPMWESGAQLVKLEIKGGELILTAGSDKDIQLNISGSGKIKLGGSASKSVLESIIDDIKDLVSTTLTTILQGGTAGSPVKQQIVLAGNLSSATVATTTADDYKNDKVTHGA